MKSHCLLITSKKNIYSSEVIKILKKNFLLKTIWSTDKRYENLTRKIANWKGDYLFHYSSYYKIPNKILNRVNKLSINFHPSPSRYPGSGGLSLAIFNNDQYFGSVSHIINSKIDNGLILQEKIFKISKKDNLSSLKLKSSINQFKIFNSTIQLILSGEIDKLIKKRKLKQIKWSKKTNKIKDIENLQNINLNIPIKQINKIERIIKATHSGKFPVKLIINKKKFKYVEK